MDVCIFYVYLYVLLSSPFVICSHEAPRQIIKAKLSVSYIDDLGTYQEVENYDLGNYGNRVRINTSPIKGQLIQVQTLYNKSELGCSQLDPAIVPDDRLWIALVKRGICTFNEKAYYAKILKAVAVIVYDNIFTPERITIMDIKGDREVEDVVAILITHDKGEMLVHMLKEHTNINITIAHAHAPWNDDTCTSEGPGQLNNTSVLFVSISFIVLMKRIV